MSFLRYVLRSVLHYRFAYAGVLAGAILGATVLLGALFAGDSVAASLRLIGEKRIGRTTHLVTAGDRFFREGLADDLAAAAGVRAAPLLYLRGTATHTENRSAAGQVQRARGDHRAARCLHRFDRRQRYARAPAPNQIGRRPRGPLA
jgi:hypothetical protein